jgi:hypothetical protein
LVAQAQRQRQMIHGPTGLEDHFVRHWTNPKTGVRAPIRGLFEQACSLPAARIAQQRLHFIGFICERSFTKSEIERHSFYLCNPALFASEGEVNQAMSQWPLQRDSIGR